MIVNNNFFFWQKATEDYAEPSPGFAATPKTIITCPQDPAWNLSALSERDSGSSDEEKPFAVTPQDAEMLHVYNTAISTLAMKSSSSADNFSSLASRLKTSWQHEYNPNSIAKNARNLIKSS